jgi:gamma-glutamyltranspeptidase/glutathione hydrolase
VLGTPGGTTIPTSVFQVFMNVVHFEKNIQDAVNAPRFHHQWIPDNIYYEEDYQDTLNLNKLKKMGHQLKKRESIGRFDAIHIDSKGKLHTGADRRGNDYGNGF